MAKLSKKSLEAEAERIDWLLKNEKISKSEKPFIEKYLASLKADIDKLASKKDAREANV